MSSATLTQTIPRIIITMPGEQNFRPPHSEYTDQSDPEFTNYVKQQYKRFRDVYSIEDETFDMCTQRHMFAHHALYGSFFSSPIKNKLEQGCHVLDIGCGVGYWAITMAQRYPHSFFIGIDVNGTFPSKNLPDNVCFVQHDVRTGLPYNDSSYDFVHVSFLLMWLQPLEWKMVTSEACRVLKTGAWFECVERNALSSNSSTSNFAYHLFQLFEQNKITSTMCDLVPGLLKSFRRLDNVQYDKKMLPIGKWTGTWAGDVTSEALQRLIFEMRQSISSEEMDEQTFDELFVEWKQEMHEKRCNIEMGRFFARKYQ